MIDIKQLKAGILKQDRAALAQAITLIESSKESHQNLGAQLLDSLSPKSFTKRIGISGTPGVGKSTFIESFGKFLISHNKKIAVLAIDPSSYVSGGSILGDKTRMSDLSSHDAAFVRPSPSSKYLGGVAKKTRESIQLCEAFGFDYILVETVGIGQSEVAVKEMTDCLVLLMQPASGDELQGIKRGILEMADILVVNKADGDLLARAKNSQRDFKNSLSILREEKVPVLLCSSTQSTGLNDIQNALEVFYQDNSKFIVSRRLTQKIGWIKDHLKFELVRKIDEDEQLEATIKERLEQKNFSFIETTKDLLQRYK